jgi:DNA-directed RNA polymerase specialized sigma24 family protein
MLDVPRPADPDTATAADPQMVAFCAATDRVRESCEDQTWQIFVQYVIDGFSAEETAKEFGVTVGYVYQVRCRVLRRYREELDRIPIPIEPDSNP